MADDSDGSLDVLECNILQQWAGLNTRQIEPWNIQPSM